MTFDKEFKEAISHLPSKEKDKLILRLLKKDVNLANRLHFDLIDTRTVDDRRVEVENMIKKSIVNFSNYHFTPGYLMMEMRDVSGMINQHVSITKDKFGEVHLNVMMLNEVLTIYTKNILEATQGKARKCCTYIIARAFKILILLRKLHEDVLLDVTDDLERLGTLIVDNDYVMKTAIYNGFDVNWLLEESNIPETIEQIHKDLRSRGYLTGKTHLSTPNYMRKV